MIVLQNDFLKVSIDPKGAQMVSLVRKLNNIEHLWQGDANVWAFHAPNLFPVVGGCFNNEIQINGHKYAMPRHGFARHSEFLVTDQTDVHAKFSLDYSEETLTSYPYKFTFQVLYDLIDNELRIGYKVINKDDEDIYFSVGAHPAFSVPFYEGGKFSDYYLEFEVHEPLTRHLFSEDGYFTGNTAAVELENGRLALRDDLFVEGALVFKSLSSRRVLLKNHKTPDYISLDFPHFESLALWAPPGAPFICIEPWIGYADNAAGPVEFSQKEGIRRLEHGHVFEVDHTIGFN